MMVILESIFQGDNPILKKILKTHIAVLGLDQAGKTTILNFLRVGGMTETVPTYGVNVEFLRYGKLHIKAWDLGGQTAFRTYWNGFIKQAEAIIFVLDSSNRSRIIEASEEFLNILQIIESEKREIPALIIANKQDLDGALTKIELMNILQLNTYMGGPWWIQEASARTGEGISESFHWIYERVTGERLPAPISIREVVVFNSAGVNIAQTKCGEIANPVLVSGFLTAIDIFSMEVLQRNLDTLVLGDRKVTFQRFGEIIGVIVMNVENSDHVAREVLGEILTRIKYAGEKEAQDILDNFMKKDLPFYIAKAVGSTDEKEVIQKTNPYTVITEQ